MPRSKPKFVEHFSPSRGSSRDITFLSSTNIRQEFDCSKDCYHKHCIENSKDFKTEIYHGKYFNDKMDGIGKMVDYFFHS